MASWVRQVFTAGSGTWVCPAGVTVVFLRGIGGGGGGGYGAGAPGAGTGISAPGGGGGGGARETTIAVDVVPGTTYAWTIGAGGNGGTSALNATAGGDTIFKVNGSAAGLDLARFVGANGGRNAGATNTQTWGGEPMRCDGAFFNNTFEPLPGGGGYGGYQGDGSTTSAPGISHYGGGRPTITGGAHGTTAGSNRGGGGGGGGGGGAGVDDTAGLGGTGGNGNAAGLGTAGTVGGNGVFGGGGGGGGGAGYGTTSPQVGANGGAGGSGRLVIEWVE